MAHQRQCRGEGAVVPTVDDHRLAGEAVQCVRVVEHLAALEALQSVDADTPWHKGTDTGGDKNGFGQKHGAPRGGQPQAAVGFALQRHDLFTQVHRHVEGGYLAQQGLCQPVAGGGHGAGNVVDRFVAVQRGTLATRVGQGVNDVAGDFEQAELKSLEQADRARTNDECVSLDRLRGCHHFSGSVRRVCRFCLSTLPPRAVRVCAW